MLRPILIVLAGLAVAALALWLVLLVSMRTRYEPVLTFVRRMNKRVTNPRVMRTAGRRGSRTAVIRHVGRTSGRRYETPIDAIPTGDGFAVVLPYGTSPDWLKNVRAAGAATLVADGVTHQVGEPRVVSGAQASSALPASQRRVLRLYGLDQVLHLQRVGVVAEDRA